MNDINTALVAVIAVQFLVIALLSWRNAGMIPPEAINALFSFARPQVEKTPQQWDDNALDQLQDLVRRLQDGSTTATPPPSDNTTTTTTPTVG